MSKKAPPPKPALDDTQALAQDGYVVLRHFLTDTQVEELRQRIDHILNDPAETRVDNRAGTQWIKDLDLNDFPECANNHRVVEASKSLLGPSPQVTSLTMRNPIGETAQQALHIDWGVAIPPHTDEQAQALFLLDDVDNTNGPTRIVPKSHGWFQLPIGYSDPKRTHPTQQLITASAGDVILFSSHAWHSGTANTSGKPRRALTMTIRRT